MRRKRKTKIKYPIYVSAIPPPPPKQPEPKEEFDWYLPLGLALFGLVVCGLIYTINNFGRY